MTKDDKRAASFVLDRTVRGMSIYQPMLRLIHCHPVWAIRLLYGSIATTFLTFAAAAVVLAGAAFQWEFEHDTPLLHYAGLLMTQFGMMPYRDFFETSMPGVFAIHAAIVGLAGPGNLAFIAVNHVFLALVLTASWSFLIQIDRRVAFVFVAWYSLFYLAGGPEQILQRDGLGILPIAAALAVMANGRPRQVWVRQAAIGLLFGLAATIKPQLALGAPVVVLTDLALDAVRHGTRPSLARTVSLIGASLAGFALPIGVALSWLTITGALTSFIAMVADYLPLHIQQYAGHIFMPPAERATHILIETITLSSLRRALLFYPAGILAVTAAWLVLRQRTAVALLAAAVVLLTIVYALYPALSGQFWKYHYMPFYYMLLMLFSLLVLPILQPLAHPRLALLASSTLLLVAVATIKVELSFSDFLHNEAKGGRVARIERALEVMVGPGETVQPIDWTAGALHAMLRQKIPIATPFFYDYHFYHHIDSPVIQKMRERFLAAMAANPPAVVVEVKMRPRVKGVGTAASFPDLEKMLARCYAVIHDEAEFRILRRLDDPSS